MKHYSITYLIGQAFKGMWRNRVMSFASILVLTACLIVTGCFYLLTVNINYNLEDLGQLNQIVVYVNEEYNDAQISGVGLEIERLDNVAGVTRVTKEEALAEEKEKYAQDYPHLFDALANENPYRDSFIITYADNSLVNELEAQLRLIEGIEKVNSRASVAESVESVKSAISIIFLGFMIVLFVVSLFVIITTVRLAVFSRREEIMIMRYVGAGRTFIVSPFIFEGIIVGIISAFIAYGLQRLIYIGISNSVILHYEVLKVMPFAGLSRIVLGVFLLVGILTGVIGSWISARKYLKV